MRNAWLFALVVAAGCHDASKDIQKLADRACECKKDKACAEKVIDDLADFLKNNRNAKGDEVAAAKAFDMLQKCVDEAGASDAFATKLKPFSE